MISDGDRWALARALHGMNGDAGVAVSPVTRLLVENLQGRKPDSDDLKAANRLFGSQFIQEVFAADPNAAPPLAIADTWVPRLPKTAILDQRAEDAGRACGMWLDTYMGWVTTRATMTDRLFLEAGGLWLLSLAVARRAVLRLDFADIYPNIYVLWVAATTYWRKSTGLRLVEHVVRSTFPHMLLAGQSTPEMMLSKMAGQATPNFQALSSWQKNIETDGQKFAAQRGLMADEATKLFVDKKYMQGLAELFMELYDCPPIIERELKGEGKLVVQNPGLSLLMATTPARLQVTMGDGEWEDGLLPRFALLSPESQVVVRTPTQRAGAHHYPPAHMITELNRLHSRLPAPKVVEAFEDRETPPEMDVQNVEIGDAALDAFNGYADALHNATGPTAGLDERLRGVYGRLPVQALKIAMVLRLADWAVDEKDSPVIGLGHWTRAQGIAEKWRGSAHRLLADLNRSQDMRAEDSVLDYLRQWHSKPPTAREIQRGTKIHRRGDVHSALQALMGDGLVAIQQRSAGVEGYLLVKE